MITLTKSDIILNWWGWQRYHTIAPNRILWNEMIQINISPCNCRMFWENARINNPLDFTNIPISKAKMKLFWILQITYRNHMWYLATALPLTSSLSYNQCCTLVIVAVAVSLETVRNSPTFPQYDTRARLACGENIPVSKVHGVNMGPTWVLSAPNWPHVGPMNLATRDGCSLLEIPFCVH